MNIKKALEIIEDFKRFGTKGIIKEYPKVKPKRFLSKKESDAQEKTRTKVHSCYIEIVLEKYVELNRQYQAIVYSFATFEEFEHFQNRLIEFPKMLSRMVVQLELDEKTIPAEMMRHQEKMGELMEPISELLLSQISFKET